jgi:hypothetical protein
MSDSHRAGWRSTVWGRALAWTWRLVRFPRSAAQATRDWPRAPHRPTRSDPIAWGPQDGSPIRITFLDEHGHPTRMPPTFEHRLYLDLGGYGAGKGTPSTWRQDTLDTLAEYQREHPEDFPPRAHVEITSIEDGKD